MITSNLKVSLALIPTTPTTRNSHLPFWPAVFFAFSCSIITEYLSPVSTLFSETIHN
jgi:hypothetical protein